MRFALLPATLCALVLLMAGCGGGDGGDEPDRSGGPAEDAPALGREGDDEAAATELGFPAFATSNTALVPGTSGPVHCPGSSIGGGGGSSWKAVPPVGDGPAAAPVGTMTYDITIRNGASARGNNDMDLFRRPAGLADGLALKEPAPRDAQIAVRPN